VYGAAGQSQLDVGEESLCISLSRGVSGRAFIAETANNLAVDDQLRQAGQRY
jgi:hypothetical protein